MTLLPNCHYSPSLGPHMRFTIEASKRNRSLAQAIQARLQAIEGVLLVSANYRTGNVLILCEEQGVDRAQLAARLHGLEELCEAHSTCT